MGPKAGGGSPDAPINPVRAATTPRRRALQDVRTVQPFGRFKIRASKPPIPQNHDFGYWILFSRHFVPIGAAAFDHPAWLFSVQNCHQPRYRNAADGPKESGWRKARILISPTNSLSGSKTRVSIINFGSKWSRVFVKRRRNYSHPKIRWSSCEQLPARSRTKTGSIVWMQLWQIISDSFGGNSPPNFRDHRPRALLLKADFRLAIIKADTKTPADCSAGVCCFQLWVKRKA